MAKKIGKDSGKDARKELMSLLEKCSVKEFCLDTKNRELHLYNKEDFDRFFPELDAKPQIADSRKYGEPYGAGNVAFFEYGGWRISGDVCRV